MKLSCGIPLDVGFQLSAFPIASRAGIEQSGSSTPVLSVGAKNYIRKGDHVLRYMFAADMAKDLVVLDYGCGYGWGAFLMAGSAKKVCAIDSDCDAIATACQVFRARNLMFHCLPRLPIGFEDHTFDLIVSFEVVEHVPDVDLLLAEFKRLIRPHGQILISTPNRWHTEYRLGRGRLSTPFHVREYSPPELNEVLRQAYRRNPLMYGVYRVGRSLKRQTYPERLWGAITPRLRVPSLISSHVPGVIDALYGLLGDFIDNTVQGEVRKVRPEESYRKYKIKPLSVLRYDPTYSSVIARIENQ